MRHRATSRQTMGAIQANNQTKRSDSPIQSDAVHSNSRIKQPIHAQIRMDLAERQRHRVSQRQPRTAQTARKHISIQRWLNNTQRLTNDLQPAEDKRQTTHSKEMQRVNMLRKTRRNTNRHFIGIEKDTNYFNIATKRILNNQ